MIAFSGGPDSICLLHVLAACEHQRDLLAVHVDHGLDRGSGRRAKQAAAMATALGVDCRLERVQVRRTGSIEANARRARYAALRPYVSKGSVLLTAHHADDVAETLLLRLIRGSGPAGLSGIPPRRRFGNGWLMRPALHWRRQHIDRYLKAHGLSACHDPANDLMSMDRNFLRHEVMPLLQERFPGYVNGFVRSARLNRSAAGVLTDVATRDVQAAEQAGPSLALPVLLEIDRFRRAEALRNWCLGRGHAPPPGARLDEFLRQIAQAEKDRQPELRWDDGVLRRHADAIWLDPAHDGMGPWHIDWDGQQPLTLPGRVGRLAFSSPPPALDLSVRSGLAGERLCCRPELGRQQVKKLLADRGVPPWQRTHWPRLWLNEKLVAIGDQWLDAAFAEYLQTRSTQLVWRSELRDAVVTRR